MGEVYRATDTKLKREVAIKVLPDDVVDDSERLARFEREAHVLASLNHPHIASITFPMMPARGGESYLYLGLSSDVVEGSPGLDGDLGERPFTPGHRRPWIRSMSAIPDNRSDLVRFETGL
jgi:serine/threonine protein kinase